MGYGSPDGTNSRNRQPLNCTSDLWNMEGAQKPFNVIQNQKGYIHTDAEQRRVMMPIRLVNMIITDTHQGAGGTERGFKQKCSMTYVESSRHWPWVTAQGRRGDGGWPSVTSGSRSRWWAHSALRNQHRTLQQLAFSLKNNVLVLKRFPDTRVTFLFQD